MFEPDHLFVRGYGKLRTMTSTPGDGRGRDHAGRLTVIQDRARRRLEALDARWAERRPRLKRWALDPLVYAVGRVGPDSIGVEAGSLTYGAFLSLPPLLVVLLSVAGLVLKNDAQATRDILDAVERVVPGMSAILGSQLELKTAEQLGVGVAGSLAIIWAASGFAARVRHGFGGIFETERTGLVFGRISAALFGTPILLLVVGIVVLGSVVTGLQMVGLSALVAEAGTVALLGVLTFVVVAATYRLLTPGHGPRLHEHVPGCVVFTAGWFVIHMVGAEYVNYVVTRSTALYGAIGAIFGLLAFLYATMWWLLFSAEITQAFRVQALAGRGEDHAAADDGTRTTGR
jgi:membrane protein